jgi:hypothetical protein
MSDIPRIRNLISAAIDTLGGDSYEDRLDKNVWRFKLGSAVGLIVLVEDTDDPTDSDIFVLFRIMKVPLQKALPFYRRLLELNFALSGKAAFCVDDENTVCLQSGRIIRDLDATEIMDLIHRTAWIADKYDDVLLDEFGKENSLQ